MGYERFNCIPSRSLPSTFSDSVGPVSSSITCGALPTKQRLNTGNSNQQIGIWRRDTNSISFMFHQFHVPSLCPIKTHVQLGFSSGRSSKTNVMHLLIVTALFLIFSAACASPVNIAARGLPPYKVCSCHDSPLNATTIDLL